MELISNYTDEEEQLVIQSALNKKQLKHYEDKVSNKHFRLRSSAIESYFLRLSYFNKKKCILKFVDGLRSPANTFQILSNMSLSHIKMESYSIVDPKTDNILHKLTWDHDRMLDNDVLLKTLDKDVEWFQTLDDEKQFKLLMGLIELCSGSIKRSLYMPLFKIYSAMLAKFMNSHFTTDKSQESLIDDDNKLQNPLEDDPEFDPKHPASIEVDRQRRRWFDLIEKYKSEVNPDYCRRGTLDRTASSKKPLAKKSEFGRETQSQIDCEIDLIQLLPIWIVKRILSYFNNNDLTKFKKINSYWSYVTTEIMKERKAREKIDQYLEKMKANIDPTIFVSPTSTTLEIKPKTSKDIGPHHESVAMNKKLVPRLKNMRAVSLQTKAKAIRQSTYDLHSGEILPFPRLIKKGIELYKFRPCSLQDVGIRFGIDEDIEKQKSVLTYSLTSAFSSMKISIDDLTLMDW